jgi:hypothetical protein
MNNRDFDEMQAYARGAIDGYNEGTEDNFYEAHNLRYAYAKGYEYGVFLYCEEIEA